MSASTPDEEITRGQECKFLIHSSLAYNQEQILRRLLFQWAK
jgi:hypothetical protein